MSELRVFIYTVTGEVKVRAKNKAKADERILSTLTGLEWTMENPRAKARGEDKTIIKETRQPEWLI